MLPNDKRLNTLSTNKSTLNSIDLLNSKKRRFNESEGLMDVKDSIITNFSQLYLSPKFSDITIKVDNETIACHKSLLCTQSEFFCRLFESQMLESNQSVIELKETDPQLFRLLLKLTYFGQIDLQELPPNDVIKLFGLIQRYQFQRFEEPFLTKIKSFINESNVWQMFDTSIETHLTDCLEVCLNFLDCCPDLSLFQSHKFLKISLESLKTLLSHDLLCVPEIELFSAVAKWLDINNQLSDDCRQQVIQCLRLTLIQYEDLMNIVSKSGLVSKQVLWQTLEDKALSKDWEENTKENIRNRAFLVEDTDLCCDKFKFEVLEGGVVHKAFTQTDFHSPKIVIKFGFPLNINNIEMHLSDKRGDRFSYKIEYSVEGLVWKTLYDYTNYTTANTQRLFFDTIITQHFRISGTHQLRMDANTKSNFDSIESFACFHHKNQYKVERIDGLLSNAYWIRNCVQQRVYHDSSHAINDQNGETVGKYYSRLLLSNKPIIVALDQPVMINSFQFLLWDRDERAYSYVVEVKDGNDWLKLADKSLEECRSLQTITFSRRPISLVRVRGIKIYFVDCNEFRIIKFHFPKN